MATLRDLLREKSTTYSASLDGLEEKAKGILPHIFATFPDYTDHGWNHSRAVEANLDWLLPDQVKHEMSSAEVFCLLVAAWFHDVGMIGELGDERDDQKKKKIRETHHIRSKLFMIKNRTELGLSLIEASTIGDICMAHRTIDISEELPTSLVIGREHVRLQFLGACLRLADACHMTYDRASELVAKIIKPKGESQFHFDKHASVGGVGIDESGAVIEISCIAMSKDGEKVLSELEREMRQEVKKLRNILGPNGVPVKAVDLEIVWLAQAWSNKGNALASLDRYEEALSCYDRALEMDPRLVEAWHGKGNSLANLGRYEEALSCFDRALEIFPTDARAWYNKGVLLGSLGRYSEALPLLKRALGIDERALGPDHPDVAAILSSLASVYYKQGNYDEALLLLKRALEIDERALGPNHPDTKLISGNLEIYQAGAVSPLIQILKDEGYKVRKAAAEALGKLGDRSAVPGGIVDRLHFTVTSPPMVQLGTSFVVDIWAHLERQRKAVIQRAREAVAKGEITIQTKGPVQVARGTVLTVRLKLEGLIVEDPEDTILWDGDIGNATFPVRVPHDASEGPSRGLATFHVNGLQIARVYFVIQVGKTSSSVDRIRTKEERHRKAFASYAHADLKKVCARLQGMQKTAPELEIFLDVISLRSGQNWEQELWKAIPLSDVFYLFWSGHARRSKWVEKEWRCALKERGLDFIDPVPLVPPEKAPPPPELASKHFGDLWLAFM